MSGLAMSFSYKKRNAKQLAIDADRSVRITRVNEHVARISVVASITGEEMPLPDQLLVVQLLPGGREPCDCDVLNDK